MPRSGGWTASAIDEDEWMRMRAEEERKEAEEREAHGRNTDSSSPVGVDAMSADGGPYSGETPPKAPLLAPPPGRKAAKKAVPQLQLSNGARARIDSGAQVERQPQQRPLVESLAHLQIDRDDQASPAEERDRQRAGAKHSQGGIGDMPLPSAPTRAQRADLAFGQQRRTSGPRLQGLSDHGTGAATGVGGAPPSSFGAKGQSLAERRSKHKRTFSTEWPTKPAMTIAGALPASASPGAHAAKRLASAAGVASGATQMERSLSSGQPM